MDVMQPLVSIVMPAYNSEKVIPNSIDSVISQQYGVELLRLMIILKMEQMILCDLILITILELDLSLWRKILKRLQFQKYWRNNGKRGMDSIS